MTFYYAVIPEYWAYYSEPPPPFYRRRMTRRVLEDFEPEQEYDTLPKNNDIENIVKKFEFGVPKMPSPPSALHPRPYCKILGHG
jgi:hypothetical protein